jgi:para-aminobenzoate synthetase component 1
VVAPAPSDGARPTALRDPLDRAGYAKAIETALEEIAAGNVYQACLTRRLERDFTGDAWALHLALRRRNPAPFACFFELPEAAIVGSSPERFLGIDGEAASSRQSKNGGAAARPRRTRASGGRCSGRRRTAPRT